MEVFIEEAFLANLPLNKMLISRCLLNITQTEERY